VLKLIVSFFFIARGGFGSCDCCDATRKGAAPTVYEKPGLMLGLVPGATDFLIGNLIDLIGNSFLDP
jgi:hypothetical protein